MKFSFALLIWTFFSNTASTDFREEREEKIGIEFDISCKLYLSDRKNILIYVAINLIANFNILIYLLYHTISALLFLSTVHEHKIFHYNVIQQLSNLL